MGEPLRLYGLNALVLNAGGGIGEAIARTLTKHGATVVAVAANNSGVEQHYARVKGITGLSARINDVAAIPSIVEAAVDKLGGIDILINDPALQPDAPFREVNEKLNGLLQARGELAITLCRAALPHLKKSPQGRIINIGLLRSCFGQDGDAASAYAEQDLADLTRALAAEAGEFSVTANYIQPGAVMTPESRLVYQKDTALRDHYIRRSAAKRLGEPVDIAKVALFLASDDAVFVSGAGITVDGGLTNAG